MTAGWVESRLGDFVLETSWDTERGEVLVLFGPSGAGKTSTLRAVAGLLRPDRGRIEVGGKLVYESGSRTWVPPHLRRVGYMTQQYHLFPHLTVEENIGYGLRGRPREQARDAVGTLLDSLLLAELASRRTWELSGGQAQRVALARALATTPDVLLLDEPFSSLDGELRRQLRGEIRGILARTNIPVIMVTHDREEALALGDTVQVIDRGRTLDRGDPLRVLGQPGQGRLARLVGVENVLPMRVAARNPRDGTMECVFREGEGSPEESFRLEAPISDFDEGEEVTVGLRASDVILATERLVSSSARNQALGTVTGVELRPPGYQVTLECSGVSLHCHITGTSLTEMGVHPGQELWAVFKASSCFLVEEREGRGGLGSRLRGNDGRNEGDGGE